MGLSDTIKSVYWQNYANFEGRASKSEFWYSVLFNIIAFIAIIFIAFLVGIVITSIKNPNSVTGTTGASGFMMVGIIIYAITFVIPNIAVSVRRLHDTGKGGGWFCISFIPYIGTIWLLILCSCKGQDFVNRFGEIPKKE